MGHVYHIIETSLVVVERLHASAGLSPDVKIQAKSLTIYTFCDPNCEAFRRGR